MPKPRAQPLSPHLQIYRPQLTSVLSFTHRLTGIALTLCSIALVAWLAAAAAGPRPFAIMYAVMRSPVGKALLLVSLFCVFMHLCGGIRHLIWDTDRGFELRTIYISGWAVVAASITLTIVVWFAASLW